MRLSDHRGSFVIELLFRQDGDFGCSPGNRALCAQPLSAGLANLDKLDKSKIPNDLCRRHVAPSLPKGSIRQAPQESLIINDTNQVIHYTSPNEFHQFVI